MNLTNISSPSDDEYFGKISEMLKKNKIKNNILLFEKKIQELELNVKHFQKKIKERDKKISTLEKEIKEKDKKISTLENQLGDSVETEKSKLEKIKQNFLNRYNIDMTHIDNLEVFAQYRKSNNPRDEYSSFHSGEFKFSYDYIKDKSNIINVEYSGDYNYSQSYENRSCPDIEFDSELNVYPNNIEYCYETNESIYTDNEDGEETDNWYDLMNKILGDVSCEAINLSAILHDLTENGKIII